MDDEVDPTIAARFSVLEHLEPPDAWSRIAGEIDVVEFDRVPTPNDRHRSRPLLVAAAVLLVIAAGVVVVSRTGGDDPEVVPPESPSANSGPGPPSAATAQTAPPSSIAETPDFGHAEIAPDVVRPGDEITITPARPVQNICTQLGAVYSIADQSIVAVVANDGHFTPGPDITIPACIGDTTDEALTYVAPDELDDGRYILCVSDELTRDGCATFTVRRSPSSATTFPDLTTTTTYPGVAPDTFLACLDLFAFATTEEGDTALVVDFDGDQMNAERTERIELPSDRLTVEVLVGRHVDTPLCNDLVVPRVSSSVYPVAMRTGR